ncbi:hypothetical protein ACFS32_18060 [Novosphingobium pokkalii]|uniref:hypothetical protein n=1 Tax=Novosphingobium pokkalii TaxID=1770194 RepID=UPI003628F175
MKGFFRNVSAPRGAGSLAGHGCAQRIPRARADPGGPGHRGHLLPDDPAGRARPAQAAHDHLFRSWRADRSDAEILKGNIEAQKKADAEEAAEEQRQEDIRKMYKAVGAATGIDTQKMYDDGTKERAAEKKAESEKNAALYRQITGKPVPTAPGLDTHKP